MTDIFISGAGPAGLFAAVAFAGAGFHVTLADPATPVTDEGEDGADPRTTAILQPGRDLLDRLGVWERLAPHATPLSAMRIVERAGDGATYEFRSDEISDAPFGWNLPNWILRREALAILRDAHGVDLRFGAGTADVVARTAHARVRLTDGTALTARLVVAADGKASPLRGMLGIDVRTIRYGQTALAFAVTHPIPHETVSTEIYEAGGPFTLVPLPDVPLPDGGRRPRSAVVWMDAGAAMRRRLTLDPEAFAAEASARSGYILGPLTLASRAPAPWPVVSQLARRLTAPRAALLGEAAHAMPPIGAQGLNLSLGDVAALLDLATADPANLGSAPMLDAYDRARTPEVTARVLAVDALNRAVMAGGPVGGMIRSRALGTVHRIAPIRRSLMRVGLGSGAV